MSREVSTDAIAEVVFRGMLHGQVVMSLFHYRLNNAIVNSDGTALATALNGFLNNATRLLGDYASACSNELEITDVTVQWVYPTRYSLQRFTPVVTNGGNVDPSLPSNVAIALLKRTFLTGPRQRGVTHMPAVPVSNVVGSVLVAGALASYQLVCDDMDDVYITTGGETFEPLIYNKTFPVTSPQIQSVTVEETTRIMRRRSVGVGQ